MKFLSRGAGYTLFLTNNGAVLALKNSRQSTVNSGHSLADRQRTKDKGEGTNAVLRLDLAGANPAAKVTALDELPGKANYFLGNDPRKWLTGVPTYAEVKYEGAYPGVDLIYYGNQRQLEYDFVVAPGADPRAITLRVQTEDSKIESRKSKIAVSDNGDLIVPLEGGEVRFRKPLAYQERSTVNSRESIVDRQEALQRRTPHSGLVDARFVLLAGNQIGFVVGKYDKHRPLIIDPVLAYSTYLGGSSIDSANGIAVAPDGSAFIAGGTFSTDFPTAHGLQSYVGAGDAFVAKLRADGSTLLYSTYLGGANFDVANAIAVDAAGEAFVTGTTNSPDFPVASGFDALCGADGKCGATWNTIGATVSNAFVTKLNVAGSALVYSSYLGYYENVQGHGIAVDGAGNAYVTGEVGPNIEPTVTITPPAVPPPPFPTTGGFETTFANIGTEYGGSGTDAFITKIDATASEILYSSYLGGSDEDIGYGIAVDSSAYAYLTGLTYSSDFPGSTTSTITPLITPLQNTNAGAGDAFFTKVNTNATGLASLVYSTYLGGSGLDQGTGVAVDTHGNAYVAGGTTSKASSLVFTPPVGAFQTDCALDTLGVCEGDAMVAKFNPTLGGAASLLYFTYLGGSLADSAAGIAVDTSGDAYVTGSTVSPNFPIAGTAFQPLFGGGNADAFVTELNPAGAALVSSTFLGGSNTDTGNGIAVDTNGGAYVTGQTCSLDFPLTNPLQATPGGNCDAFVSKIVPSGGVALSPAGLIFPIQSVNSTSASQAVMLTNGGSTALTITSIALTGADTADFSQTNTCDGSVPAYPGNCIITVTFTPLAVGTLSAQITIKDNSPAPNSTQVVDLTGIGGNLPTVSLSSYTLAFGNQAVNVTSSPLLLTVTNTGTAALNLTSAIASGDFAVQTNGCTAPLQATTPPSNCTISVTFTPTSPGPSVDSLTLTDNAPNSPQMVLLTGTGVLQPAVSLSPTNLTFAAQAVGTSSAAQSVVLTNTGSAPLTITSINPTGLNSGDFSVPQNSCPAALAVGASCAFAVTFTPTAAGVRLASVSIADNAPNTPQNVPLTGTGVLVPSVTLSTSSLTFASQLVGTTSTAQVVTVKNSGGATLIMSGVTVTTGINNISEFAIAQNTCTTSVAAGANCTISVTFDPTVQGSQYQTLVISDNAADSPQNVSLSGTGVAPAVSLSPPSVTFTTPQLLGTTSPAQSVILTNTGNGNLNFTGLSVSGDYALAAATTCSTSAPVAPSGTCTIAVTFTPTATGSRTGTVIITDNASSSPQSVSLSGTGVAPAVSLSPTSLTFTGTSAGVTTAAQTVVLTNTGNASLTITSVSITGINNSEFLVSSDTCLPPANPTSTLLAGANCAISVTFTPTATGTQLAAVSIADNAPGTPQTVGLTGLAPAVTVLPTSLTFASTSVGATSAALPVTLTNSGTATLLISNIATSGDFAVAQPDNCLASVVAGANCTISVTFTPTAVGNRYGTLSITDSAANSPQTVALAGTGAAAPTVALAPTSLTFADQPVNTTSSPLSVILTNSGGASLTITSITVTGLNSSDFAVSQNTCPLSPATLVAGAGCAFAVTFTPTVAGARLASVSIMDNASNSPQSLPLSGNGILLPSVTLSASSLTFGSEPVGTTSPPQTVTLTNSGGAALNISSITTIGDFAVSSNPCGASLAAGASCVISVTFTPTAAGTRSGSLVITDNAPNSPQAVTLVGGATAAPAVTLSATSLTFPSESPGVTSPAQTVTLTNTGTASLTITSIAITGPFAENTTCGATLPTSANCSINITFTPTVVGTSTGTVTITDNAPGSPQTVTLGGAGSDFSLASSPPTVTVYAGTTADYTLTLTPKFGFNAKIALTCSGAPSQASCQVTPATITLDGTNPGTATLTVPTTARVSAWPRGGIKLIPPLGRVMAPLPLGIWLLALLVLTSLLAATRRRRAALILVFTLCCVFLWGACGGGGTLSGVPSGTPAGTSTLTVTATSGAISHNISVTLTVN